MNKRVEQVLPTAEALSIKVLVEPEPDLLMEKTSEFTPFIKEVQSPAIGLNFDIGHFFCAGEDPAEAMEALFKWIGHMHVEDIAATREHNHLIAGLGAIDFEKVFQTMGRLGYDGDISLELYPYVDTPDEAGKESRAHLAPIFERAGGVKGAVEKAIDDLRGGQQVNDPNAEDTRQALEKYTIDLTERAEQGKLDPIVGRDDEIRRTIQILQRRTKNNPVLIGEPGVGKTAIVEGLASRIARDTPSIVPPVPKPDTHACTGWSPKSAVELTKPVSLTTRFSRSRAPPAAALTWASRLIAHNRAAAAPPGEASSRRVVESVGALLGRLAAVGAGQPRLPDGDAFGGRDTGHQHASGSPPGAGEDHPDLVPRHRSPSPLHLSLRRRPCA